MFKIASADKGTGMNLLAARAELSKNDRYKKDSDFVLLLNKLVDQGQKQELTETEIRKAVERLVLHGEIFDE